MHARPLRTHHVYLQKTLDVLLDDFSIVDGEDPLFATVQQNENDCLNAPFEDAPYTFDLCFTVGDLQDRFPVLGLLPGTARTLSGAYESHMHQLFTR